MFADTFVEIIFHRMTEFHWMKTIQDRDSLLRDRQIGNDIGAIFEGLRNEPFNFFVIGLRGSSLRH